MAFWYLDKTTNEAFIFGSITALCSKTGLKPDNFYRVFSRERLKEYETSKYRVVKTEIIRGS